MRKLFSKLVAFATDILGLNMVAKIKNNAKHILMGLGVAILVLSFLLKGLTLELFGLILLVSGRAWQTYSKKSDNQ